MGNKLKYLLILPLFFISTSLVKADGFNTCNGNVSQFKIDSTYIQEIQDFMTRNPNELDRLISYYNQTVNSANHYPYYYITLTYISSLNDFNLNLYYSDSPNYSQVIGGISTDRSYTLGTSAWQRPNQYTAYIPYQVIYDHSGSFCVGNECSGYHGRDSLYYNFVTPSGVSAENIEIDLPLVNHGIVFKPFTVNYSGSSGNCNASIDTLRFEGYQDQNIQIDSFYVYEDNIMPDMKSLLDGSYSPDNSSTFTEINLNNYDYVILNLTDYTDTTPIATNIYTLGQLCSTRVNDYGRSEAFNPSTGNYSQGCTDTYLSMSPVRFSINSTEIENKAVWYIKAYNTNISNVIKVDPTVFDITYVDYNTQDPTLTIGNVSYNVIPFDDLSSTANMSTANGYISGQVVSIFDNVESSSFSDLFSNPLGLLQSSWATIVTIMNTISIFIAMLPPVFQGFIFTAFGIGVILGIVKIIL